jgi:hypothetical protein
VNLRIPLRNLFDSDDDLHDEKLRFIVGETAGASGLDFETWER